MRIDNPTFTPGSFNTVELANGLVGNEWSTKETTVVTAVTTAPTKNATLKDYTRYRKVNSDTYEIIFNLVLTATGTAGSGDYLFRLPSGITWDAALTRFAGTATNNSQLIEASIPTVGTLQDDAVNRLRTAVVIPYDNTRFRVTAADGTGTSTMVSNNNFAFTQDGWALQLRFYTNN
jgi:hypothetical protein